MSDKYCQGEATAKLVGANGILLEELMKSNHGLEFSIEAPHDETNDSMSELRVDSTYEYDEYMNHVNLDCLTLDDDEDSNLSPFDTLMTKMTNLISDGGVMKRVMRAGAGGVVPNRSLVFLHYNTYLELEEVPFDSSYLRSSKHCFKLRLGEGSVYPGFELAIASMEQGEKSQFLIQPNYAFREMGVPPRIPPNATILLEAEVLKFISGDIDGGELEFGETEGVKFFRVANKKAQALLLKGKSAFENNSISSAIDSYKKAADLLTNCSLMNDEEETSQKKQLLKIYRNLCVCYSKTNNPKKVCIFAREATFIDPVAANSDAKLHFNWGKALFRLANYSKATEHLKKARSLNPNCKAITEELVKLEEKRKEHLLQEKITYQKALRLADPPPKTDEDTSKKSELSKKHSVLIMEIETFYNSNRNRMELPPSMTFEEKEVAREAAAEFNLEFKEIRRTTGEVVFAIVK